MRKGMWLVVLLAGCQTLVTPLEPRRRERADDPLLTTQEQARRARYLYAFPDTELGPRSGPERPVASALAP
ncbi:MAG: hypothetical protein RMJ19_01315 [Gemmatales bacterium]|nr:hypothetical protein [Gemmatales bacterium]MCS7159085.1 hypothetical protein [Gemmatales bacterium]MDW8174285.1 hypothetical protein [Gemmatales bacterium]MDW8221994.1 hypothetical protein [Gemmatales bacterium]